MCGIFGLYNFVDDSPAKSVYYGIFALQHRGQESAGIAVSDGKKINSHRGMGLVNQVFDEKSLSSLKGRIAMGQVRYSTTGSSIIENAQPIVIDSKFGPLALGHNGNLINTAELRQELQEKGVKFVGTSDSEIIIHMIAQSKKEKLEDCLMKDKNPGILLEDWINGKNISSQGLPNKNISSGNLYYWYPRSDNNSVARFGAFDGRAGLNCNGNPSLADSGLGVRAVKEK